MGPACKRVAEPRVDFQLRDAEHADQNKTKPHCHIHRCPSKLEASSTRINPDIVHIDCVSHRSEEKPSPAIITQSWCYARYALKASGRNRSTITSTRTAKASSTIIARRLLTRLRHRHKHHQNHHSSRHRRERLPLILVLLLLRQIIKQEPRFPRNRRPEMELPRKT